MQEIVGLAELAIRPAVILFMIGNLLAIGLETDGRAALAPLTGGFSGTPARSRAKTLG